MKQNIINSQSLVVLILILLWLLKLSDAGIGFLPHATQKASWYSKTDRGIKKRTANNEIFDDRKITCASWHYPFGTYLKVTNLANKKSIVCRVNDRGPAWYLNRDIDLTRSAFSKIADLKDGIIEVHITPIKRQHFSN